MVLRLIGVAAVLACGCNQSLFDANTDNTDGGIAIADAMGAPDAPADGPVPDGPVPDASIPDANVVDAVMVDAAPPACADSCEGQLVDDFNGAQGGANGRWRYLSDQRTRTWTEMALGVWNGINTFVGGGTAPGPAVISCPANTGELVCQNDVDAVLLAPAGEPVGYEDPAVAFIVPTDGLYTISGDFRATSVGADHAFMIYRNTREDVLFKQVFATTTQPVRAYSFQVEALAGDRLITAAVMENAGTAVPIAVKQYISRDVAGFPGQCGMALRFEAWTGANPDQECGALSFTARRDTTGNADYVDLTSPELISSVIPEHGMALSLREGDYLRPDTSVVMDYSEDFTIQMWMSFPNGFPPLTRGYAFADPNNDVSKGASLSVSQTGVMWGEVFWGTGGSDYITLIYNFPNDGAWRFVRLVRDKSAQTLSLCIDGALVAQDTVPAAADAQTDEQPEVGGWPNSSFSYWQGAVDDVRFFSRALPCN